MLLEPMSKTDKRFDIHGIFQSSYEEKGFDLIGIRTFITFRRHNDTEELDLEITDLYFGCFIFPSMQYSHFKKSNHSFQMTKPRTLRSRNNIIIEVIVIIVI